jgi:hypothetical protein
MNSFVCEAVAQSHCVAVPNAICQRCNSPFVKSGIAKFCGAECRAEYQAELVGPRPKRTCQNCGIIYKPKKSDSVTYCSRECSFAVAKRKGGKTRDCAGCTKPFRFDGNRKIYCSADCRKSVISAGPTKQPSRDCKRCGSVFTTVGRKWNRFCSDGCEQLTHKERKQSLRQSPTAKATRRRSKRAHRRLYGKTWRSRCQVLGLPYEAVRIDLVFDRDRWRCQLCGCKTHRGKRGTAHPKAPTLDHIIPVTKGGGHLYSNVQCACRECNTMKGNRTNAGQLNMFPNPLISLMKSGGRSPC